MHLSPLSSARQWYLSVHVWEDPGDGAAISDPEADQPHQDWAWTRGRRPSSKHSLLITRHNLHVTFPMQTIRQYFLQKTGIYLINLIILHHSIQMQLLILHFKPGYAWHRCWWAGLRLMNILHLSSTFRSRASLTALVVRSVARTRPRSQPSWVWLRNLRPAAKRRNQKRRYSMRSQCSFHSVLVIVSSDIMNDFTVFILHGNSLCSQHAVISTWQICLISLRSRVMDMTESISLSLSVSQKLFYIF